MRDTSREASGDNSLSVVMGEGEYDKGELRPGSLISLVFEGERFIREPIRFLIDLRLAPAMMDG